MGKQVKRDSLAETMCSKSGRPIVEKVVRFRNQDVPKFLAKLEEFERASRRSRLMVG